MSSLLRGTRFCRFRGLSGLRNGPSLKLHYSGPAEPIPDPEVAAKPIILDFNTKVTSFPLPPLPPALPSGPITPGLTQEDFSTYINPLYKRTWEIDSRRKFTVGSDGQVRTFRPTWLNRKYEFATPAFALSFFTKIVHVFIEENHIPITFGIDSHSVFIHTATPGVERPTTDELVFVPTYRDIRIAFRAESIFEQALQTGEASPTAIKYTRGRNPSLNNQFESAQPLVIARDQFNAAEDDDTTAVSDYPVPASPAPKKILITDADFPTYLMPLYLHGWHFNFVSRRPAVEADRQTAPRLARRIPFQDFDSAVSFMQTAAEIAVSSNSEFMATVTDNVVHLYTTTNMGLHFGITHIDISLAIRMENLLQQQYADSMYTGPDPLKPKSFPQPTSVAALEKSRVEIIPHSRKRRTTLPERSS